MYSSYNTLKLQWSDAKVTSDIWQRVAVTLLWAWWDFVRRPWICHDERLTASNSRVVTSCHELSRVVTNCHESVFTCENSADKNDGNGHVTCHMLRHTRHRLCHQASVPECARTELHGRILIGKFWLQWRCIFHSTTQRSQVHHQHSLHAGVENLRNLLTPQPCHQLCAGWYLMNLACHHVIITMSSPSNSIILNNTQYISILDALLRQSQLSQLSQFKV